MQKFVDDKLSEGTDINTHSYRYSYWKIQT